MAISQTAPLVPVRKIEPELFGPLGTTPAVPTGIPDLFPGEEQYLSKSQRQKRVALWRTVSPILAKLLASDERVLYAAPAMQRPTVSQLVGLGYWAQWFHQVLLVFTDKRLVEILLDVRGTSTETRIRCVPWTHTRDVQLGLTGLMLRPVGGKKHGWSMRVRGDRKVLKALLPRMRSHLRWETAGGAGVVPLWHCPTCCTVLPDKPEACASCGTQFRSWRIASILSLAFPGAGLLYAGRPVLGLFDLLGELMAFGVIAVGLAVESDPAEVTGLLGLGAFLFVATKAESIHVGHLLLARTVPEPAGHRRRWNRLGVAGGVASVLALASIGLNMGRFASRLDRDLDFSAASGAWTGSRTPGEWQGFTDDPHMRSQWRHRDGWVVSVFAYPLRATDSLQAMRAGYLADAQKDDTKIVVQDAAIPAPFGGFRFIREGHDEDGEPVELLDYFIQDDANADIHQVMMVVGSEDVKEAEATLEELIAKGHWIVAKAAAR